jgi:hypothetical protein
MQVQITHSQLEPQGQFWHFMMFSLDDDKRLSRRRMSFRFLTPPRLPRATFLGHGPDEHAGTALAW